MGIVLDYTSRIAPSALKAAGVVGVCRYLAPLIPKTEWKRITKSEYDELERNGIQVTLNWEYDARDWLAGSSAGRSHGTQAASQARALGYPQGRVIVGSADFDMTRTQWLNGGRAYAKAFAKTVREGGYRPGVYGPWDVLQWTKDEGLMDAFWQAGMSTAWSAGRNRNAWPGAHIRQRGHKSVNGSDTDWNEVNILPLWGGSMSTVEAGGTMFMIRRDGETGVYVYDEFGNQRWHVQNEPERDWLRSNGMPLHDGVSDALFNALTSKVDIGSIPVPPAPVMPTAAEIAAEIIAQLKGAQQ